MKEPGCSQSMLYQEVSHANLTALVGNVWRLMMSAKEMEMLDEH